jgi:type II secretory pathway component PulF
LAAAGLSEDGEAERRLARAASRIEAGEGVEEELEACGVLPAYARALTRVKASPSQLGAVLAAIADGPVRRRRLLRRMLGVLAYPALVLALVILVGGLVTWRVLPLIAQWRGLAGLEPPLPIWARGLSVVFSGWGAAGLLAVGIGIWIAWRGCGLAWRARLLGPVIWVTRAGILRTLATALRAEVPLEEAIGLAADSCGDTCVRRALQRTAASCREGKPLSGQLVDQGLVPAQWRGTLAVGEERSSLSDALLGVADVMTAEAELQRATYLTRLSTVLTVLAGALVTWIGLAIFRGLM